MNTNRIFVLSIPLILLAGGLAGCMGGNDVDPDARPGVSDAPPSTGGTGHNTGGTQTGAAPTSPGGGGLTGAGATFPFPLIAKWSDEYGDSTRTQVNYQSIGSGGGIRQHTEKTVVFGASEATLTPEQANNAPGTMHLPMTLGQVVMAYNVQGVGHGQLRLSGDNIADIYLGKITRWNDARLAENNPGVNLPDQAITVAHRSDGSGTTFAFTDYLSKVSPEWKEKVGSATSVQWPTGVGGNGNEGVTGVIQQEPGAIGYISLSYAELNDIPVAQVRNAAGNWIQPTLATTSAAAAGAIDNLPKPWEPWTGVSIANAPGPDSYSIASFSYYLVYQDLSAAYPSMTRADAERLVHWLWWSVTKGQEYAEGLSFAKLPAEVIELNKEGIRSMTFQGQPLFQG